MGMKCRRHSAGVHARFTVLAGKQSSNLCFDQAALLQVAAAERLRLDSCVREPRRRGGSFTTIRIWKLVESAEVVQEAFFFRA